MPVPLAPAVFNRAASRPGPGQLLDLRPHLSAISRRNMTVLAALLLLPTLHRIDLRTRRDVHQLSAAPPGRSYPLRPHQRIHQVTVDHLVFIAHDELAVASSLASTHMSYRARSDSIFCPASCIIRRRFCTDSSDARAVLLKAIL